MSVQGEEQQVGAEDMQAKYLHISTWCPKLYKKPKAYIYSLFWRLFEGGGKNNKGKHFKKLCNLLNTFLKDKSANLAKQM